MKLKKPRLAVFFGGEVDSHEVSTTTGTWLCYFLPRGQYDITPVRVTPEGHWQVPLGSLPERGPIERMLQGLLTAVRAVPPLEGISRLLRRPLHALLTVLRGKGGDDGTLHGLAETIGVPMIGSPRAACQVSSDKYRCGQVLSDIVLSPATRRFRAAEPTADVMAAVRELFIPPLFIKPVQQECSVGVCEVASLDELGTAMSTVRPKGDFLVQQRVPGTEVSISLFDDAQGQVHALPATVIQPKVAGYYDSLAKRRAGRVTLHTVPGTHDDLIDEAEAIARDVYRELGARGLVSVDVVAGEEALELLDVNTVPILSPYTPLLHQLRAARVHPGALFDDLLRRSLR